MVLEEIAPEDKTRNEILGARVNPLHGDKEVGYWPQRLPERFSLRTKPGGSTARAEETFHADLTIIRGAHLNEIPPGGWPVLINGNWARS